jgi:5'-3' exonuclease
MAEARGSLMLLDSASMYFRAFHGVPDSFRSPDDRPVNAVRGFLDMTATLLRTHPPRRLVACWDDTWRPAFRVALVPSYKSHRLAVGVDPRANVEEVPDDLTPQIDVIADVLAALGIARVGVDGFEADDVIGTLATRGPGPVDVVSGDRDLVQLVDDDAGTRLLYIGRGVRNLEVLDDAAVQAKYGIRGRAYADLAAMRGDPSDGLPGVPGIGEKTAASLLQRWGSAEELVAAADEDDPALGQRAKIAAARDYLLAAVAVTRVRRDCPLPPYDDVLPAEPADGERLLELADRWGVESSVNRMLVAMRDAATVGGSAVEG